MKYFTVTLEKYPQPYLKVYFLNDDEAEPTKLLLEQLPAVDHINITPNNAQTRKTLTIYISKVYEPEEARQEVIGMLDCHLEDKMVFQEKKAKDLESFLAKYPDVLKQYKSAKEKYEKGIYERNVLDDMRLALELLVLMCFTGTHTPRSLPLQVVDNDDVVAVRRRSAGKSRKSAFRSSLASPSIRFLITYEHTW